MALPRVGDEGERTMKKSEIEVGGRYRRGKVAREVVAMGPQYILYSGVSDTDGLRSMGLEVDG